MKPALMKVVLYEGEGALPLSVEERTSTLRAVLSNGYETVVTGEDSLLELDEGCSYVVLGKFQSGHPERLQQSHDGASFFFESLEKISLDTLPQTLEEKRESIHMQKPGQWKPWFPAIDYDRCTNCLQCLSFCLFDVYGMDSEQKIQVQNPTNCKTDCPACSRVCPEVAIIFPKYKGGPINGNEVNEADLEREKMKVDISTLLGGDIYASLRDRRDKARSRFTKERDEGKALQERMRCLAKLKKDLDIPDEALNALPSMEAIQAKAQKLMEQSN